MFEHVRILGAGRTRFSSDSGRTVLDLALEAVTAACADAGVPLREIDGACTFGLNDTIRSVALLNAIGSPEVRWLCDLYGGGTVCLSTIALAALAIESGLVEYVAVFRALNGRSGRRLGGRGSIPEASGERQFTVPVGWTTYGQVIGMMARRHMEIYGTTSEQLGAVAVSARQWAILNDWAMMKTPMSLADHHASPLIADPLRLLDYCLESDAGYAFILGRGGSSVRSSREIRIEALATGGGPMPGPDDWGHFQWLEHSESCAPFLRTRLQRRGFSPGDADVVCLFDAFTFGVVIQLEGFGFCERGAGGEFAASGALAPGGARPVNTHGGLLSEGYAHGFNHLFEAVAQLRGECGGRQLRRAELAFVGAGATTSGGAVMLSRP